MIKKVVKIITIVLVFGLVSFLIYKVIKIAKEKNTITNNIKNIPKFNFKSLDDKKFTNNNLKSNLPSVFIYFNSECDFCQHEAQSISENLNRFKAVQFVFVSTEPITTIQQFSAQYNLNKQQNITFLHDQSNTFSNRFGATTIPYILMYDKNQKLIKKHNGQLNASGILRVLQKDD